MKRIFSFFVMALLCVCAFGAWTPETLPVPENTNDSTKVSYVSNPDGVLSASEVSRINSIMFSLEKNRGVRGLIIAVRKIEPDDPYEFTIRVGEKHGIGGKSNTGFIIMVASESRAYEIMPGMGLEKFLTDGQCGTIGRDVMVPLLKEGKWGEALVAGVQKVADVCNGEEELAPEEDDEDEGGSNFLLWFGGGLAGLIGYGSYRSRKNRECPKCKQHNYRIKLRHTVLAADDPCAPTEEEINEKIQSKLLSMKVQKNSHIADMARKLVAGSASPLMGSLSEEKDAGFAEAVEVTGATADAEATKLIEDVEVADVADDVEATEVVENAETADVAADVETAEVVETVGETNLVSADNDNVLKLGDTVVTPAVAAAALSIAETKKAFDSQVIELTKEQKKAKKGFRNVRLIDTYECPDCGYIGRKETASTTRSYKMGLFTSGAFGALAAERTRTSHGVHGSDSGSSSYGSGSSSRSSYSSSSHRSSHSWGSSGGGHFGGGGAGGRF